MRSSSWHRPDAIGIQGKMLVIILPLMIIPILVLAAVGFVSSSREASEESARFLTERENDLRILAENVAIRDFFFNRFYRLDEEAEIHRHEVERWLLRFAQRSNAAELVYSRVRYVDDRGDEIVSVDTDALAPRLESVADSAFFAAMRQMPAGEVYLSPVGERMTYAMPVYERLEDGAATFLGGIVLDFVYPLQDFRRTTLVIAVTFVAITFASLVIALPLTVTQVRRLTHPIRRLSEAADGIAAGDRSVRVEISSDDEIGRLAQSFNKMAESLADQEEALRRRGDENRALYEIGQEITAQVNLEPTLQLIAMRAKELLRADVSLLVLREEDGSFGVHAQAGPGAERLAAVRLRPGEGVSGRVVADGRPVLVRDYTAEYGDSPFLPLIEETELRAMLAVPLHSRSELVGVLSVFSRAPSRFTEDGLQLLSALANQAAISIENAKLYHQVSRYAEDLEQKVAERTRELQEANLKLQEASSHKSKFLANMSHELRTPMNAIIGFTRLVMRKSKDVLPQRQYENLEKILISADHLLGLINSILDLAKIEAGRVELHPTSFDPAVLIDTCLRTIEPTVRTDAVRLVRDVPDDLPRLFTDQDKVKQVLINLLSNAAKFTHAGTIRVTARRRDTLIDIAVADTGIGIPKDKLAIIFEEFQQADDSTTRVYGGTGLGLAISRRMARLIGGDIAVDSEPGRGATFTVTIPIVLREQRPSEERKAAGATTS